MARSGSLDMMIVVFWVGKYLYEKSVLVLHQGLGLVDDVWAVIYPVGASSCRHAGPDDDWLLVGARVVGTVAIVCKTNTTAPFYENFLMAHRRETWKSAPQTYGRGFFARILGNYLVCILHSS